MPELQRITEIDNPFNNAPVYYVEQTGSTMHLSEKAVGIIPGTVFSAGMQTAGRGRLQGRVWEGEKNNNLLFTLVLSGEEVNGKALPIRVGLGIALYLEKYHQLSAAVKWPNDIYINGRKVAGIIIESRKKLYNIGIGLNVNQIGFPEAIASSATSLALEKNISFNLYTELELVLVALKKALTLDSWQKDINTRLYGLDKEVILNTGVPEKEKKVKGLIEGIGGAGQLLLRSEGSLLEICSGELVI